MTEGRVENLNIESFSKLTTPEELHNKLPITERAAQSVIAGRKVIKDILDGTDKRLFIVVGPCSIHDPDAAIEYGGRLVELSEKVQDSFCLVMRAYFEKPRTTVGWKGLINDPRLNDSFEIEEGLHIARRLLVKLAEMGLPLATEALDPISPQFLQGLISWSAIGARTSESQTHREMSSGLSCAVGFKNGTDGGLSIAINGLKSVNAPHNFLGIDPEGHAAIVRTSGNRYAHIVLRGGNGKPNFDSVNIARCENALEQAGIPKNIMVDCSHANSSKDPKLQPLVAENVTDQILEGNRSIVGLMLESNLNWGNQSIPENLTDLKYGVSITDACIDWATTEQCILNMHHKLKDKLPKR